MSIFGRLKTGYKALGLLSDFNSMFKVQTTSGSPSNIWGHKRTWVLLGALAAGIGPLVAGDTDVMRFAKDNMEAVVLIAGALYGLFHGMRSKSDEGAKAKTFIEVQNTVARMRAAVNVQGTDDPGRTPDASDGGGA